jgi:hypothetical protein
MSKFHQRHPQEFMVQFGSAFQLALLMKALTGIECCGGVIQAIGTKGRAPYVQCILVILNGAIELVELDVDTSNVVQYRGDIYVVGSQGGLTYGKCRLEEGHGLFGRFVLLFI